MNTRRPRWSYLFFAHLSLVVAASVLATRGRFSTSLFRAPFDKVGHLIAYGGLAFLAVSFCGYPRRWKVLAVLLAAAVLEELSQRLFPTRTFDLGDLAMNVMGIVGLGTAATVMMRRRAEPVRGHGSRRCDTRPEASNVLADGSFETDATCLSADRHTGWSTFES